MWHTLRHGKSIGPFTDQQMRLFVLAGRLAPKDQVWKPGMASWMAANRYFRFPQIKQAVPQACYRNPYGESFTPVQTDSGNITWSKASRLGAAKLAFFLGALGFHKFYLGYYEAGVIMAIFTVFTCGYAIIPMALVGVIEGIIYLRKNDDEFYQTYVAGKRNWM